MIRQQHLSVRRTARYYVLGSADRSTKELWFVLHGYGQLAADFINHFALLDDGSRLIVAPEALNRFYLVGPETMPAAERPVGATWMTREDREHEIDDYVAYLDEVADDVLQSFRAHDTMPRIIVLAFSQGTATGARWIVRGTIQPSDVVLWGGLLPPEMTEENSGPLRRASIRLVIGSGDRFVSSERLAKEERRLREAGLSCAVIRYTGGHGIAKEALREVARQVTSRT
jgi:predicted esterase